MCAREKAAGAPIHGSGKGGRQSSEGICLTSREGGEGDVSRRERDPQGVVFETSEGKPTQNKRVLEMDS